MAEVDERADPRAHVTERRAHDDRSVRSYLPLVPSLAALIAHPVGDQGREPARTDLAAGFLPLVRNIARRFRQRGEPLDDLEQVGFENVTAVGAQAQHGRACRC